ncbi:WD40/YVTN/BNR-like repeat-containing protein [Natrialba swarupiae]|uniref:Glycosyl hydrolase n=1 Tax=Natrialba swarupiae TaxID=2448032 RepID=A0A5D5ANB2_9EURY|nr:hypothetical protein [Natrialba swarupiae]TYT62365.1 hypothetical protein FYC77_09105 [Natrialba swarupiae]
MVIAYVALRDRLLVCRRDAAPNCWDLTARLEGHSLECVAASSGAPERVFVGTFEDGLYRSTDGGDSWSHLEIPAGSDAITSIAIDPNDAETVYAGTEPSRVYRSTDGGDSWSHLEGIADLPSEDEWFFPPRPHTHHVRWLAVDPFDPDRLYVGIEAGTFVLSTDGGDTWHERPEGSRRDNHSLTAHPDREGLVYSAAGDGFAVSTDGGEHWEHPQEGLEHRYCWSVVTDPGDPDGVMVSSASGASSAHTAESAESYVYRRRGDQPWDRLDDRGLPTGEGVVRAVFDTTDEDGVVYAVTNLGLFVTDDFGDRWERVEIEWEEELEAQTPRGLVALSA